MVKWHIGCSGFYYKHWKGVFYPEGLAQSKWFKFYTEHFNSLELNGTFYRAPTAETFKNWYKVSPGDFSFAVKAPRMITHYKKFRNTKDLITAFYDAIQTGLGEKLGAVLFQMPPRFVYNEERLENMIANLEPGFNNVLEFRDASWWNNDVYKRLAGKQVTFCGISHPQLPSAVIHNTPVLYYRFHGKEQLYSSEYTFDELSVFTDEIKRISPKQVFVYFNNDIGASAIRNARALNKLTM